MSKIKRISVLWENVTGYVQAALRALLEETGVELFIVQRSAQANAEFDMAFDERTTFIRLHEQSVESRSWLEDLLSFESELALITGTPDSRYREAARRIRQQGGISVWANDRVLRSPPRDTYQWILGRLLRMWRDYDAAFVPGHEAARYAHHIGFPKGAVFQGLYTCDTTLFRPIGVRRHAESKSDWPSIFLFVGQLIERKGIDILVKAYETYRRRVKSPWELWCVGTGPLRSVLKGQPGVQLLGFLPPEECATTMAKAGVLILPSRWDHWGVVIHEATCAGLPVLASRGCAATVELVQDGYNGFTFPANDEQYLAHLLTLCSDKDVARSMGANSLQLSYRFDPPLFARALLEHIPAIVR